MGEFSLVENAIHRPDEPRHFMEFQFPDGLYTARFEDLELARSRQTLKLSEVGYHIYDPVIYFPLADVSLEYLRATSKSTHCPLKGDTCYYDLHHDARLVADIAWRYSAPYDFARTLENYLAFDARLVRVSRDITT